MSSPKILFTIGNFSVHLYGVMVLLGFGAGMYVVLKEAERKGFETEKIIDLVFWLFAAGLAGARALFVILNWDSFRGAPLDILSVHQGGLAFHGAVLAGILVTLLFARRNKWSFAGLGDLLAPGLALGYAVGRIGCDIYGNVTAVPWAVVVGGEPRHPVQLYSALAGFVIFFVLWRRREQLRYNGESLLLIAILYSVSRFFIEFFRSQVIITPAQYASVLIAALCFALCAVVGRKNRKILINKGGVE